VSNDSGNRSYSFGDVELSSPVVRLTGALDRHLGLRIDEPRSRVRFTSAACDRVDSPLVAERRRG
jgi:hypothetical protein